MEDEASGLINCFDNFYSYASVSELEVARYRDKPDVAVIQITNIAGLLMHHLFDNSLMWRWQYGQLGLFAPPAASGNTQNTGQEFSLFGTRSFYGTLSDGLAQQDSSVIPLR